MWLQKNMFPCKRMPKGQLISLQTREQKKSRIPRSFSTWECRKDWWCHNVWSANIVVWGTLSTSKCRNQREIHFAQVGPNFLQSSFHILLQDACTSVFFLTRCPARMRSGSWRTAAKCHGVSADIQVVSMDISKTLENSNSKSRASLCL